MSVRAIGRLPESWRCVNGFPGGYLPPLLSDFFTGPVVLARTTIRKTG